ncbi:MAG: uracil-DNA glycosylase family protein [Rubellimicrobium sp.]|nr:uracil-DNA glycosylase family protein [Rubellimicrobium sp.]
MPVPDATAPEGGDASAPLRARIAACRICAARFAATATAHEPRPVVWFRPQARLLIAGQAPGRRVHASGIPFDDPSGDRLRDWLGLTPEAFHDLGRVAIVPMAFCFPGQDERGADLPPPPVCARTWRDQVMAALPAVRMTVLVGGAAIRWHLGAANVTRAVRDWRAQFPRIVPLPHPSWRNTGWLGANPWFAAEVLPALRDEVARLMETP